MRVSRAVAILFLGFSVPGLATTQTTDIVEADAVFSDSLAVGDKHVYKFTGSAGDRIFVSLIDSSLTDFEPEILIRREGGPQLWNRSGSDFASPANRELPENASYRIEVTDASNSFPGDYRLDFNLVPGADDGGAISNGAALSGSLARGEILAFPFLANSGEHVIVTLADASDNAFSPEVFLLGPDGTIIAEDAGGTSAWLDQTIAQTGSHTLVIRDDNANDDGDYLFDFSQIPGANDGTPALQNDVPVTGALATGEVLAYQFNAEAGDSLTLTLNDTGLDSYNPQLQLFDPSGSVLRLTDDGVTASIDARDAEYAPLTASGTYTVLVSDENYNTPGNFRLQLGLAPAEGATVLQNGLPISGTLALGELSRYQFDAADGDRLIVTLTDTNELFDDDVNDDEFRPRIDLFAPDGSLLATDDGGVSAWFNTDLAASGTYTLIASDRGYRNVGDFRIDYSLIPGANDGGALQNGVPVTDVLDAGEVKAFQYTAAQGDVIEFSLTDTQLDGFTPDLELFGPSGESLLTDRSSSVAEFERLMLTAGTYTVVIGTAEYNRPGNFQVDFVQNSSVDQGVVASGAQLFLNIPIGERWSYRVAGTAGDQVKIRLNNLGGNVDPVLALYGPDGERVAFSLPEDVANGERQAGIDPILPLDGIYTVVLYDESLSNTGEVRFRVDDFTPLPNDQDGDFVTDGSDNCPAAFNPEQLDLDGNGDGDACDTDDDGDLVGDDVDNCPLEVNPDQLDSNLDGEGNACDDDDDGDLVLDGADNCPVDANETQVDTDGNGAGDACDTDDDGDQVDDVEDNCPLVVNPSQIDTNGDGDGNLCDDDDDGDLVLDGDDNCPLNVNPSQLDTDGNGEGNACDVDDDGDGLSDEDEAAAQTDPLLIDTDGDGVSDFTEVREGSNPLDANDVPSESQGLSIIIIQAIVEARKNQQ